MAVRVHGGLPRGRRRPKAPPSGASRERGARGAPRRREPGLGAALLALLLGAAGCEGAGATVVRIDLLFPVGQSPLAAAESLAATLLVEGAEPERLEPVSRPRSGSWDDLDAEISLGATSLELVRVRLEGLDRDGALVCLGETVPMPVVAGRPGRLTALLQEVGSSGLVPGLPGPLAEHAAAYLPRGGVLLAGGSAASPLVSVYALDVYEPVELSPLGTGRARAAAVGVDGGRALVLGGAGEPTEAEVYDPVEDTWSPVALPAELRGEWPDPAVTTTPGGAVVVARGRWVARLSPGSPIEVRLVGSLPDGLEAASITALGEATAVAVGPGETAAAAIDLVDGSASALPDPPNGPRTGHAALALPDGRLALLAGAGRDGLVEDLELLEGGAWQVVPGLLGGHGRSAPAVVRLGGDRVLLVGGRGADGEPLADALVVDLSRAELEVIPLAQARAGSTATLLPWGAVLVAGGVGAGGAPLDEVEALLPRP